MRRVMRVTDNNAQYTQLDPSQSEEKDALAALVDPNGVIRIWTVSAASARTVVYIPARNVRCIVIEEC